MHVGTPGNIDKGYCLKCKTPLVVELPDKIRFLCPDCVKDVQELIRNSKSNKNLKRTVLEPGQYRQRMPDGRVKELRNLKRGKR